MPKKPTPTNKRDPKDAKFIHQLLSIDFKAYQKLLAKRMVEEKKQILDPNHRELLGMLADYYVSSLQDAQHYAQLMGTLFIMNEEACAKAKG